jgi:hypothetical protein
MSEFDEGLEKLKRTHLESVKGNENILIKRFGSGNSKAFSKSRKRIGKMENSNRKRKIKKRRVIFRLIHVKGCLNEKRKWKLLIHCQKRKQNF